jgi:argininosuccinate synthase
VAPPSKILFAFAGRPGEADALGRVSRETGAEIVTLTLDVGQAADLDQIRELALGAGATRAHVLDVRERLVTEFMLPALRAGGACEGDVPLSRALIAPILVRSLVDVARMESADAIAHGSRDPEQQHRVEELAVAASADTPVTVIHAETRNPPDPPRDLPLVRRSVLARHSQFAQVEGWDELPSSFYRLTQSLEACPDKPAHLDIEFEQGLPVSLNGVRLLPPELLESLDTIAGAHGVGRFDGLVPVLVHRASDGVPARSRLRHVGEAPALLTLVRAYDALERAAWPAHLVSLAARVGTDYRTVVRRGWWFTPTREALAALVDRAHAVVNGTVRLRLFKGGCGTAAVSLR